MNSTFSIQDFVADRRDQNVHSRDELFMFSKLAGSGAIPDYQLSAWLMAAFLNPLSEAETVNLTMGMAQSGETLDLSSLPKPWVDKHSTGGVGDKTTLVVLPILAACGATVVKMSGRGLGITGGTIDKLASVPGFSTDLTPSDLIVQAKKIGLALGGQSKSLVPADKILYSLRDATETVGSLPLIVSSILSKKIACGAEVVTIDVKCGSGGFMPDYKHAFELKNALVSIGTQCGLNIQAHITDMSQPLGSSVGNAIEVREAIAILSNKALSYPSQRFREFCLKMVAMTLVQAGLCENESLGFEAASHSIISGKAEAKARVWFRAQGAAEFDVPCEKLANSEFLAPNAGFIQEIHAGKIGASVVKLGGGRVRKEDEIDLQVGIEIHHCVGDKIQKGEKLLTVLGRTKEITQQICEELEAAIVVSSRKIELIPFFLDEEK